MAHRQLATASSTLSIDDDLNIHMKESGCIKQGDAVHMILGKAKPDVM